MTATPASMPVTMPAVRMAGPPQGKWCYADYAAIPDEEGRFEVVDGVLFVTPAPNIAHQHTILNLSRHLAAFVEDGRRGLVLAAPTDVQMRGTTTVVQPDILVILNDRREIITASRIVGAPNLVVEVSSPSTATYDRRTKMDAYARAGVSEYWLVDPVAETLELLCLEDDAYVTLGLYQGPTTLPSRVLPGLPLLVEQLFG